MKKTKSNEEYHDFNDIVDGAKEDLSAYIEKRLSLAKLTALEKGANLSSRIMYAAVMLLISLILGLLLVITSSLFLGRILHNYSLGFGIVFLFFIALMGLIALNKRKVRRFFVNMILRTIKRIEADED